MKEIYLNFFLNNVSVIREHGISYIVLTVGNVEGGISSLDPSPIITLPCW